MNTPTFRSGNPNPATDKQRDYIASLLYQCDLDETDVDPVLAEEFDFAHEGDDLDDFYRRITPAQASEVIEFLQQHAHDTAAYYAGPDPW